MSTLPTFKSDKYDDGVTEQGFKDSTDINKILTRHARAGTLSHLEKYQGEYGDLANFDFDEAQRQIARANSMFEELPAEIKREFGHNPKDFIDFVNDPANMDKLAEKLPQLAEPGRQMPTPDRQLASRETAPEAPVEPPVETPPAE